MPELRRHVGREGQDLPVLRDADVTPQSYRAYVASQLARYEKVTTTDRRGRKRTKHVKVKDGWSPIDALADAKRRDEQALADDIFTCALLLARLCNDEQARAMPDHALLHELSGIVGCVGERMLAETARSLKISDDRARALVAHFDQTQAAVQGLQGSE